MRIKSIFYPSINLQNIRFNVILLHAIALIIGGLYVIYAILQHQDDAIRSQLFTGVITLFFGFFNIFAARIRSQLLISISLGICFFLLMFRSFTVIDPTQAAIGINMALLSLIVLFTIYYSARIGLSLLLSITLLNFVRWYAIENDLIHLPMTGNTGIFETNVLVILSIYSCVIAGYYQYQSKTFIQKLEIEKSQLIDAINELRTKEKDLQSIIKNIRQLSDYKLPQIKPNIEHFISQVDGRNKSEFNLFLKSGNESMRHIDQVLRSIDEQIKAYDIK